MRMAESRLRQGLSVDRGATSGGWLARRRETRVASVLVAEMLHCSDTYRMQANNFGTPDCKPSGQ
jgi:hypothetical protein